MKSDYLLVLYLENDTDIQVGSIGNIHFQEGTYIYTGSARSGLWRRVKRHLGRPEKKRWHIDHLTSISIRKAVWWRAHREDGECLAAELLGKEFSSIIGFGCSDCRCGSHLFYIGDDTSFL
jgi:sugar fermentation stimulation protein A